MNNCCVINRIGKSFLNLVNLFLLPIVITITSCNVHAALPTLSNPVTENVGAGMATLILQSGDTGKGYFTLLAGSGTACGTGTQVKGGQDSTGAPALRQGSLPLIANTAGRYTVRNLMQNSTYTICFTADSPAGQNLQKTPATSGVVTSAAISLADKQWGAAGSVGFSLGQAWNITLVVAPDGTPYLSYQDLGKSEKATVMKYRSGAWSVAGTAGFSLNPVQSPSMAFAPDGTPYIAYQDMGANNNWKATVMRFDGTSWVAVGTAAFTAGNALYTSLAFAPDGTPHIAYMDYASGYKATVMKFSDGVWSLVGSAGFSAGQASGTSLAFAADGTPFVAYRDGGNGNKITVQKFNGNGWVTVGNAGFSAGSVSYTKLAFSPNNTPYVAFEDMGNNSKATAMKFNGSYWEPVGVAGFSPSSVSDVSLAFSPDGSPVLALQDGSNGNKITVMTFNGAGWSVMGSPGFSSGSAHPVSLAFAPDGRPYVAYGDSGASWKATVMTLDSVKSTTTTTIVTDKNIAAPGESITFTARVLKPDATGTVSFMDGAMLLGTASLSNGVAALSTTALTVGIHSINAVYAGDSNYSGSTSVSQRVEIYPINIVVTSTITSPASGYITNATSITVSGTAAGDASDPVNLVEVSINGGATWQPAVGSSSWSKTIIFPQEGIFAIKSRATTIAGTVETPKSGISVTIDRTAPTGNIVSAVLNDAHSLTIALNTRANTPGMVCLDFLPIVCGYQDISLSYDGVIWTPWHQALATQQHSITMTGIQTTIYAKLRDSTGNVSAVLSAPVKITGICGSANKVNYATAPTTNLCTLGSPSSVTGIGPWFWSCAVLNGDTPASCSAAQAGGVVYRSNDAGVTWTAGKTGIGLNASASPLLVSPNYASDHTLFLGADGIYRSMDSGDTWTQVQPGYMVRAFAVSPAYVTDRTVFAGTFLSGVYKSTDGGSTWSPSNSNIGLTPMMVFSLAISPAFSSDHTIFTGNSGEVYKSTDGGASWFVANTGTTNVAAFSLAISPAYTSDQTIFAASTSHIHKSTDGGSSWILSNSGVSGEVNALKISPGYARDQTLFATTSTGVYKSTDKGANWTKVNNGNFNTEMALSPNYTSDQTLFAGVFGVNVFNSTDGGGTWTASNSDFATSTQLASLSVSPVFASDHTVFAVTTLAAPAMMLSTYNLAFNQTKSHDSLTKQITISNEMPGLIGLGNLAISGMTLSGTNTDQFSITPGTCTSLTPTIASGGKCSFDITFTPTSTGNKNAILEIVSNNYGINLANVSLAGTGITAMSTISTPTSGFITNSPSIPVSGAADCSTGDSVSLVEVSSDGGTTWQPANGTTSWSIDLNLPVFGSYTVVSRATTAGGIVETPGTGITIIRSPVVGDCGGDNDKVLTALAPASLCTKGTPSAVSGKGHPWSWVCQGDVGTEPTPCSASVQTYTLAITLPDGTGTGDVLANLASNDDSPVSIFCPKSFCSAQFDYGKNVSLTATPNPVSLFTTWGGDCTAKTCSLEMTGSKTVSALFSRAFNFKNTTQDILGNALETLVESASSGDEIRMLATELTINSLILNKTMTLTGGWNGLYLSPAGASTTLNSTLTIQDADVVIKGTTVKGSLSVQSGSLRVEGLIIMPH